MLNENELIMLVLGFAIMIFIISYRAKIRRMPLWKLLITAFGFLVLAWIFTITEVFFMADFMNFMEHLFYASGALLLAYWCMRSVPEIKGRP